MYYALRNAYNATPVATPTLRLPVLPRMECAMDVHKARTSAEIPPCSSPTTRHAALPNSSHRRFCLLAQADERQPLQRQLLRGPRHGRDSAHGDSKQGARRRLDRVLVHWGRSCAGHDQGGDPEASAVRAMAPRLRTSVTPSKASIKGSSPRSKAAITIVRVGIRWERGMRRRLGDSSE